MSPLPLPAVPDPAPGTEVRLVATNDLLGAVVALPTSWGASGTVQGVARLLEAERTRGTALWLDSGDLSMGGPAGLFGDATLDVVARLPLAAAAAGNHELDDGVGGAAAVAARLGAPLLCADRDAGLPGTALVPTPAGPLGVVGITHRDAHRLAAGPPPAADHPARIVAAAGELRRAGARWVVALLHEGATWWATGHAAMPVASRPGRLLEATRGWAACVDAILGGHTLGAWRGTLHGVPAGHAHAFAASALVVDLPAPAARPMIHPPVRVPGEATDGPDSGSAAIDAAARRVVGRLREPWSGVAGATPYLAERMARALRRATRSDAGFVAAHELFTQAPLDGAAAALRAGPVSRLDVERLLPFADDDVAIVELGAGELERARAAHDAATDPGNVAADDLWWNWARSPAGVSTGPGDARNVAVSASVVPLLRRWIGRDADAEPAPCGARAALIEAVAT